ISPQRMGITISNTNFLTTGISIFIGFLLVDRWLTDGLGHTATPRSAHAIFSYPLLTISRPSDKARAPCS
ncbi:MAG: hypothetical protein K2X65_10240, partial [Burkholderiaceae bacterium]|nr:hypothetical protein [Burkholderiaceae bacterium]